MKTKVYGLDVYWQDYKPTKVLDWLGIEYEKIKSIDSIPLRPNDICIASQKQFFDEVKHEDWNNEGIPRAVKSLSSKFKKVILINDDYTGQLPKRIENVYILGLELQLNEDTNSKNFRKFSEENKYYFNYCHYRTFYEKSNPNYVKLPELYPNFVKSKIDKIRNKAYFNTNRYPKSHRLGIIIKLIEHNIFDIGYNSMLWGSMEYKDFEKKITDYNSKIDNGNFLNIDRQTMDMLNKKLPIILKDEEQIPGNSNNFTGADTISVPYKYLLDSYFSIVTESHNREVETFLLSEKIAKPILGMHPFILLAQPYSLKYLRDKGFETFSEIIDESYDNEISDQKRFSIIVDECVKLFKNNTQKDLHNIYYNVLYDKIEHNYYNFIKMVKQEMTIIKDIIDDKL